MPKIWCEHAIMNVESIVTVELCCSLKICHIHNVLNMAIPQTSKIFSAYLSKQTICIYVIIRCLWVISVCVRDSFFFQKTVILKFALSRTSRNTPALINYIIVFFISWPLRFWKRINNNSPYGNGEHEIQKYIAF